MEGRRHEGCQEVPWIEWRGVVVHWDIGVVASRITAGHGTFGRSHVLRDTGPASTENNSPQQEEEKHQVSQ